MKIVRNMVMTLMLLLLLPMANAASAVYSLKVDGLACPFCAYGIEKKLSAIDGVEQIDVDIKEGQVIVIMADGASRSDNRVAAGGRRPKAVFRVLSKCSIRRQCGVSMR